MDGSVSRVDRRRLPFVRLDQDTFRKLSEVALKNRRSPSQQIAAMMDDIFTACRSSRDVVDSSLDRSDSSEMFD